MKLKIWQVDAFASRVLEGNPAAIVPLGQWLGDAVMQAIAGENNLAETAFFVRVESGRYNLRWFTPKTEVDLCGHATLASAFVIFHFIEPDLSQLRFMTRSGELVVTRCADDRLSLDMPTLPFDRYVSPANVAQQIGEALHAPPPDALFRSTNLVALWEDPNVIPALKGPGEIGRILFDLGFWGLIVTAEGNGDYDFISRFFAPLKGVPEDPVTGSAHCALTSFWEKRLGRSPLRARQVSPRGGELICHTEGVRTILEGRCALFMSGDIYL